MNTSSQMEERWRSKRLEKKREGVEIRLDAMEAHANENGDRRMGGASWLSPGLDVGSNERVPEKGLERRMGEMKSWVCGG